MGIASALDALVVEHDRIGSPLRKELIVGLPAPQVAATIRGLGLIPPRSLVELHSWHDIRPPPPSARVDWFWPAGPLRLDEAVREYQQALAIGGISPHEIAEILRVPQPPGATNTGYWRTDWFPILKSSPETYAIECTVEGLEDSPVWRQNWHPDAGFESAQIAPSLADLLERVLKLFRAGAYAWDTTHRAVVAVDAVFQARGLLDYRP